MSVTRVVGNPHTSAAKVNIFAAMLGVAITFAIQKNVESGWNAATLLALPAFICTVVIFTIALMNVAHDVRHNDALAQSPARAIYGLGSDILTVVILCVMAFHLQNPLGLYLTNMALRTTDMAVEFLLVRRVELELGREHSIAGEWIWIDAIPMVLLSVTVGTLWVSGTWAAHGRLAISGMFFITTAIATWLDLRANFDWYFRREIPEGDARSEETAPTS